MGGVCCASAFAARASAATGIPYYDSFESGVNGSNYQTSDQQLQSSTNHPHSGTHSAEQVNADPNSYNSTYTMSSNLSTGVTGTVETDVWLWDDHSWLQGQSGQPVAFGLTLAGETGGSTIGFGTDYAELGVIAGSTGAGDDYKIRVRSYDQAHGTTWFDTGVARTQGFTHLQIVADANPSDGGDGLYHFFINGTDVTPTSLSRNTSVGLNFDRIGWNSKSYQYIFYDDFAINTPEPASLSLLGLGALGLLARRRRNA